MALARLLASALVGLLAAATARAQAPEFTLHLLPGKATSLNDSNLAGLVKPYDATRSMGGLYNLDTGAFSPLTWALPEVRVTCVADSGWVAGVLRPTGATKNAVVVWNPSGGRATLRWTPRASITGPFVNAAGRVAWGEAEFGRPLERRGYSWSPGQGLKANATLDSVAHSMTAVSSQGWIVGHVGAGDPIRGAYVSAGGQNFPVPYPQAATLSQVMDANTAGHFLLATVHAGSQDPMRGYVWRRGSGTFVRLRHAASGRSLCLPTKFNDIGDVVGLGVTPSSPLPQPMLWTGNRAYTLPELLGGSFPAGWTMVMHPLDINDHGYILGWGVYQGQERHFVMKPVGLWDP